MPWGRLDDRANDSPKLRLLSDAAWRMWGCGLIYCQAHLTDGFIPEGMVFEFGVKAKNIPAVVDELLKVKVLGKGPLWHRDDGGYRVHDYHDWNDRSDDIRKERDQSKARMDKFRKRQSNGVVNAVTNAVRYAFSTIERTTHEHPSTTTTIESEKQERCAEFPQGVENSPTRVRLLRRIRSRETADGQPPMPVLAAVARDVLLAHPAEDEGELHELLKHSCAKANLHYDGGAVTQAISQARAQLRKGVAS